MTTERIDTQPPHGLTTAIPSEQFSLLLYDIASSFEGLSDDEAIAEAVSILGRNGIIKRET